MQLEHKKTISLLLEKGFLASPEILKYESIDINLLKDRIKEKFKQDKPIVLNNDIISVTLNDEKSIDINWLEFDRAKTNIERGRIDKTYEVFLNILNYNTSTNKDQIKEIIDNIKQDKEDILQSIEIEKDNKDYNVIILNTYIDRAKEREVSDFCSYYNKRYDAIKKILINRPELSLATSISRLYNKQSREEVTIIGMVFEKSTSKNGNLILKIEDPTGRISVIISKSKMDIYNLAKDITLDEVIGITGSLGDKVIFLNKLFFPDIQNNLSPKSSSDDTYCAFISDIHVGSKLFLRKEFEKFIDWINGNVGSDYQRQIALKIKYIFIVGDTIDGVGIYPGQDKELDISDVVLQYKELYELLDKIRKDIKLIICGGNHDAIRMSEPQPPLSKVYAEHMYKLNNAFFVSNPSMINIHSSIDFEGFNVLMYHGASFHYYIDNIESIRNANSRDNPHNILKYLLVKRHLAPSHGSTMVVPDSFNDYLVIEKVPDIFVSGDMHRSDVSKYKETILINCSCWQSKTPFQEKTGNNPDPGKVPIVNLKTREVKIIKFLE